MGPSPAQPPLADRARRGLTLVELMVTITIIAILATLFLGALVNAQNDAKLMKTRSMIVKLNNLIMPRYESYRTRRVPMQIQGTVSGTVPGTTTTAPRVVAQYRLNALHDIMRMEMPDRMTDIIDGPVTFTWYNPTSATTPNSTVPIPRPALSQAYYQALVNVFGSNLVIGTGAGQVNTINQGAECLYMIVSLGFVDELGGRDLFNESSIGDTDSDGLPEFLDAWGTPIALLRWAPGFTDSELQGAGGIQILPNGGGTPVTSLLALGSTTQFHSHGLSNKNNAYAGRTITVYTPPQSGSGPGTTQTATIASSSYTLSGTSATTTLTLASPGLTQPLKDNETFGIDPDPFDPLRCYPSGAQAANQLGATYDVPFALYPLIYSAGPNRTFGIITDFNSTLHYTTYGNYPYLADTLGGPSYGQMIGTMTDIGSAAGTTGEQGSVSTWEPNGWQDNVHNHLIGLR